MRRSNFTSFDEYIPAGTTWEKPVFTSNEINAKLGHWDQFAVQVVIDNVAGSGSFDLVFEHSADGRNFSFVSSIGMEANVGDGDIQIKGLAKNKANTAWGAYSGEKPLLGYVRFRMYFGDGSTAAHVRVHVTQRDQS